MTKVAKRVHWTGWLAVTVVLAFALTALLAPVLAPYDPVLPNARLRLAPPSAAHWFGTDHLGRDIFSRLVYGTRVAYAVGVASALLASVIGVPLGLAAGFFGGTVDRIVSGLVDLLFAFPAILLAVALVAVVGSSATSIAVVLGVLVAPTFARVVRSVVLSVRTLPYVEAARAGGVPEAQILMRHILPNTLGPIVVQMCLTLSYAVIVEASLSYIGLGVRPPTPSWGGMLLDLYGYLETAPWASLFPGAAIVLSVVAANIVGDVALRLLDPVQGRR